MQIKACYFRYNYSQLDIKYGGIVTTMDQGAFVNCIGLKSLTLL